MIKAKFDQKQKAAIIIGLFILLADFLVFRGKPPFIPLIAVAITVSWLPFWMSIVIENKKQKSLESRFPDFVRNLTGAIKSGMPASQAVIHVADTDYGALTPYTKKLSNQIEWAIPFHKALTNFGKETDNMVIKRAIATVIQAEQAGGNIEDVLMSITESLLQIKKTKEERKSSIHAQVIQSYIIFFVFLGVMVIIQNMLIPYMSKLGTDAAPNIVTQVSIDFSSPEAFIETTGMWFLSLYGIFLMMALIQGAFAGIVLGKLAEGDLTSGIKHSLILSTLAFIIISFAQSVA